MTVYNVLDTNFSGGADPTGTKDSTAAIQAALDQIVTADGGILYIPAGDYKLASGLAYSSNAPLHVVGDGPQAARIRLASVSTGITYVSITQTGSFGSGTAGDGTVIIEGLSFYQDHYPGAASDTCIALYLSGVNFGQITNCAFYQGTGAQRVNQAIVCHACNQVDIDNCNVFALVNGIAFTGYCQVNNISNTSIWCPAGTGVSTAASVLYYGKTLTANMFNVIMHDGDRAIYWTQDSSGNVPHLFFGYNVQPNNHSVKAMQFDYGAQVYLDQCFFSGAVAAVHAAVPGLVFGPGFEGSAIVRGSCFNGQQGHTVELSHGTGFIFEACEFGGNGTYKFAGNAYDEINVASGVGTVTIDACHFNVDALAGLGTTNPPRSAVHTSGTVSKVTLTNCRGAGSGYGSAAVVDGAGAVMKQGCTGLGLADGTTGGGATVTAATATNLSASITIPAGDMIAGKVYKFTAWGHGRQATGSAVDLSAGMTMDGTSLGAFTAGGNPAAGAAFNWKYECDLRIGAVGGPGTAALVSNEVFTWGGAVGANHGNDGFTSFTTTSDNALVMTAQWASTTGNPTITGDCTTLEVVQGWPSS
jgi:Pectate lyase superfamily protein